ncbi:hypothetical protein [Legionella parisiensis]|uniref:Uncharacterized protein n=1 Tax=Legionella parisiensis TaxID=45071 RepID=A0A1E5JPS0_9GAMM|nr:hypothetical protein [Legionella parisiensis]KTD42080.1 hypothetical protein Lpar_3397 [Legionella parisiensis]OEH46450.1 hypothetical protein lpari_02789 [Legionella parisiensis]STX75380.1 Uncharacterised protein [Legionella parisiensis]
MPKKKPLKISKEFVEQVVAIIANESEEGRKRIVAIARRAEEKYEQPVKSWITGWVYQYTRTRGEKIGQSINVMKDFPDAYTRLQELKLMISDGAWNEKSSYNYFLFLELVDAVPDYQPLEEHLMPSFIMDLKDEVLIEINSFMAQYKATLEDKKAREIERQAARESARQIAENVMVFNSLAAAKQYQTTQKDKTVFSVSYKDEQWHISWVDVTGEVYPLTPGDELAKNLETLEDRDIEKLNMVNLRRIKRECLKAREQYLAKVQLVINPENPKTHCALTNDELIANGVRSTFVLRRTESEISLCWINSIGSPISINDHSKLTSWLADHKAALNEADVLQLKAYLLQLNTSQSIDSTKLDKMNNMLSKVLQAHNLFSQALPIKDEVEQPGGDKTKVSRGKIDLKQFALIEQHMKSHLEKVATDKPALSKPEVVDNLTKELPKKLDKSRYAALSQLPTFWQQHKVAEEQAELCETKSLGNC